MRNKTRLERIESIEAQRPRLFMQFGDGPIFDAEIYLPDWLYEYTERDAIADGRRIVSEQKIPAKSVIMVHV